MSPLDPLLLWSALEGKARLEAQERRQRRWRQVALAAFLVALTGAWLLVWRAMRGPG